MIYEWFKLDVRIYYLQYYARFFSNFLSAKQYQLSCLQIYISLAGLLFILLLIFNEKVL